MTSAVEVSTAVNSPRNNTRSCYDPTGDRTHPPTEWPPLPVHEELIARNAATLSAFVIRARRVAAPSSRCGTYKRRRVSRCSED